jgi:hypothetical protein
MQPPSKYDDDDAPAGDGRPRGTASIFEAAAQGLAMPVTGMEAEFNVVMDGVEIDPRKFWGDPTAFIDQPLLRRTRSSLQLPTGEVLSSLCPHPAATTRSSRGHLARGRVVHHDPRQTPLSLEGSGPGR